MISRSAKGMLSDQDASSPAAAMRHRNGIKMLVYLLHSIATQAAKANQPMKGAENATKAKPAGVQCTKECKCCEGSVTCVCRPRNTLFDQHV